MLDLKPLYKYSEGDTNVSVLAFSPDERYIASSSNRSVGGITSHSEVYVRLVDTGEVLTCYRGHTKAVTALAWLPRNITLASGGRDQTLHVWNALSGETYAIYPPLPYPLTALAWSPDGRFLLGASSDISSHPTDEPAFALLEVWEAKTQRHVMTYQGHQKAVFSVEWSSDGTHIASGSADCTVQVWNGETGQREHLYQGHSGSVGNVAWSPNGEMLASVSTREVKIWNVHTEESLFTFQIPFKGFIDCSWSPDGKYLVTGGSMGCIWDIQTGELLQEFLRRGAGINRIRWSSSGRLLAFAQDTLVQVWEVTAY